VIWQDGYRSGIPEDDLRAPIAVATRARELGLEIAALTPYMTHINSLDTQARDRDIQRFVKAIDVAGILGCRWIRVYAGEWIEGSSDPDLRGPSWALLVESLQHLGGVAANRGVTLCVENHFNTMAVSAAETARLMTDVGHPAVGILYDQANLTFTHQEEFGEAIELQAPWIRHVHVKDVVLLGPTRSFRAPAVNRVAEDDRPHRSRVIGDGILPWGDIFRRLAEAGYRGGYSIEYEYRWHPQDLPEPEVGFEMSGRRIRQLLASAASQLEATPDG
jgi:L-ribulose-5-phosphate 3-epimerase